MLSQPRNWYLSTAFLLLLPTGAFCTDVQINGVCVQGTTCPGSSPADSVQYGQSIGPTGGNSSVLVNADTYSVSWVTTASYNVNGTFLSVSPVVTYTGASPTTTNDIVTVDFFQNFYDTSSGTWDGTYTEHVPLSLTSNAASGSYVEGELYIDGTNGLGLAGPVGPGGSTYVQESENLTGFPGDTNSTLLYEYEFTFDFTAGTTSGATAASVPEPSQLLPLGVALSAVAIFGFVSRRRLMYPKDQGRIL